MSDKLPWEANPALTLERLSVIADIIVKVRRDVANSMDSEEGDGFFGMWVAGTRAHARLSHHLKEAAQSGRYPWLELVNAGMQFTFAIEGTPIRIYRGEPEKPTRGARKVSPLEAAKQEELFDLGLIMKPDLEWAWRIAVETDPDGRVFAVYILQVGPGAPVSVRNRFAIPLGAAVAPVSSVLPITPPGVELPPAEVDVLEHTSAEEGDVGAESSFEGTGTNGASQVVKSPTSSNGNGH
jgi:hypothetical protein